MGKVKKDNYYVVQAFMVQDLKLKGLALSCYAIIYGFSQTEGQVFKGSLQYLCDWTGASKQAILNALKHLVEKGFLIREDKIINGVKFVEYYVTNFDTIQKTLGGICKKNDVGMQKSCPNNILDNINDKKGDIKDIKDIRSDASFNNISLTFFTEKLTDYGYIQRNDLFISKYNELFENLVNEYGFELVRSCFWYFIKRMKEGKVTDIKGHSITNKFEYLKVSLEQGIEKLTNEEMLHPYEQLFENK